jgi:hypothetical protein
MKLNYGNFRWNILLPIKWKILNLFFLLYPWKIKKIKGLVVLPLNQYPHQCKYCYQYEQESIHRRNSEKYWNWNKRFKHTTEDLQCPYCRRKNALRLARKKDLGPNKYQTLHKVLVTARYGMYIYIRFTALIHVNSGVDSFDQEQRAYLFIEARKLAAKQFPKTEPLHNSIDPSAVYATSWTTRGGIKETWEYDT